MNRADNESSNVRELRVKSTLGLVSELFGFEDELLATNGRLKELTIHFAVVSIVGRQIRRGFLSKIAYRIASKLLTFMGLFLVYPSESVRPPVHHNCRCTSQNDV